MYFVKGLFLEQSMTQHKYIYMICCCSLLSLTVIGLSQAAPEPRGYSDSVTDGTELVFAFMVHRHGDRTPVPSTLQFLKNYDTERIKPLIEVWGYGQLTDVGRRTSYNTGKFIRRRYHQLLAPRYNQSQVYIRSTDYTRTKMSVLTAMSAVYPPIGKTWSDSINWVPTPYTTLPPKYDFALSPINCPNYTKYYYSKFAENHPRLSPYGDVIAKLSDLIGFDLTKRPVLVQGVYDVLVSLISLGYDIGDDIRALLPELKEACDAAWSITCGEEDYVALQAGVLLNEFFIYANKIIAGDDTQVLRIYSGHDTNVYSLQLAAHITPKQGLPNYGSLFSLELRRNGLTGQYFVLPVYLPDPNNGVEKYLQIKDCGVLCDFNTFYQKSSKYLLDEVTWRKKCGFTEDLQVNSSD